LNVKLAFYSFNKLRFIKVHKGVHKGFQIIQRKMWYTKCSDYNAIYMGQIVRKLLSEFQNTSIEILSSNPTDHLTDQVILESQIWLVEYENFSERFLSKHLTSEFIKLQTV